MAGSTFPFPVESRSAQSISATPTATTLPSTSWSIPESEFTIGQHIGNGSYGGGARGQVARHDRCCNGISTANRNVVCKHRQHTDRREIDLLLRVRHPNVFQFLALVESPSCMVLELMPHGSLFDVLQSNRNNLDFGRPATDLPWACMLRMAHGVASVLLCAVPVT
jgi:hypothetical protein